MNEPTNIEWIDSISEVHRQTTKWFSNIAQGREVHPGKKSLKVFFNPERVSQCGNQLRFLLPEH